MQKFLMFFSFLSMFFLNHAAQPVVQVRVVTPDKQYFGSLSMPGLVTPEAPAQPIPLPDPTVFNNPNLDSTRAAQRPAAQRQPINQGVLRGVARQLFA